MFGALESLLTGFDPGPNMLILAGVALGSLVAVFGFYGAVAGPAPASRFRPTAAGTAPGGRGSSLVKERDRDPSGLMKTLLPANRSDRTRVQRQLAHAGITGKNAVLKFYLVRALLGVVLPLALLATILFGSAQTLPGPLGGLVGLSRMETFQLLTLLVAVGFYGPTWWLKQKVSARQWAISNAFPNALDLMQISTEAGLGFDAAMARVAIEIEHVSPEISEEFLATQREILAGRDRDKALMDMADRMGIDEAASFANVILQSMRFGTSISDALLTYADEMRHHRELRAQEKANKLPVQMSGVMAALMLPALLMLILGPVAIRYTHFMATATP